jgi:hypothetical protein
MINDYKFVAGKDSPGNNILQAEILAYDIPKLKVKCDTTPSCVGFNTDGWLKNKIIPELLWTDTDPTKGIYYTGSPISYTSEKIIKPLEEATQILTPPPKIFNDEEVSEQTTKQIMEKNPIISFSWRKICYIMTACICLLIFLEIIVKLVSWIIIKF